MPHTVLQNVMVTATPQYGNGGDWSRLQLAGRCQPPPECGCDNDEHRSVDRRDRRRASIHCCGRVAFPRHVTHP